MNIIRRIVFFVEFLALAYGVYSEVTPQSWAMHYLPSGMGLAIALIAIAMIPKLVDDQKQDRDIHKAIQLLEKLTSQSGKAIAVHETEFYQLWPEQMTKAEKNVDVTHLGPRPPSLTHGKTQKEYFNSLKAKTKACGAQVRRVERDAEQKRPWIKELLGIMRGVKNFSLALYRDPWGEEEMPAALSVSRIDDKVAWIVAIAEHQSTTEVRDLMIVHPKAVDLLRQYFQSRLWDKSIILMENGKLTSDGIQYIR